MAALAFSLVACGGGGGGAPSEGDHAVGASSGSAQVDSVASGQSGDAVASGQSAAGDGAVTGTDSAAVAGSGSAVAAGSGSAAAGTDALAAAAPAGLKTQFAQSATHDDAFRFLTQATFGPTDAAISDVMARGPAAWIDSQLALPTSGGYVYRWDSDTALAQKNNANATTDGSSIASQFYYRVIYGNDQLRQRVAYALSQIMVTSMSSTASNMTRASASYMDVLNRDALGSYRTLLQDVTLHPAMGMYLSSMHNVKENPATGQMPDQNFAREVMQLMSIGLEQLNIDGSPKLTAKGTTIPTYTMDDIVGLSKVFTGWSWYGHDTSNDRFWGGTTQANQDPNRQIMPMQAYPQFHSTSEKAFLGVKIAPQGTPDPAGSLKTALDTIAAHPNVGPFIGRQLIQRLVGSNPSPAYVSRVAKVFNNNGQGVRGDLGTVVKAILLDPEARTASGTGYGKVREPVLRLTAWMRAFNASSDSGIVKMWPTDDPIRQLDQTPLRAGSVFNFYRPGYVAPGSVTGASGQTMPELQITNETSVAGYINYMTGVVSHGVGQMGATRLDIQPDYRPELALVSNSSALVGDVTSKLIGSGASTALKSKIQAAVDSIVVPVLRPDGSNQSWIDTLNNNRMYTALLLTVASPEFIVQK